MKRQSVFVFLAAGFLLGGYAAGGWAQTISLKMKLTAASYSGACPATLKGTLGITVDRPCAVEIATMRSDRVLGNSSTVRFAAAGTKIVRLEFPFNGDFKGWVQAGARATRDFPIFERGTAVSERIPVDIVCRTTRITGAEMPCQDDYGGCCSAQACNTIRVRGTGFGAARGSKRLLIDGTPVASYTSWSDTMIVAPAALRLGDHLTTLAIDDGSTVVSENFNIRFLMTWYMFGPRSCRAGADVTLQVWGGGTSQAGRTLILTDPGVPEYALEIISWTGTGETGADRASIHFRVPAGIPIPAVGAYSLKIKSGGTVVSKVLSFGVSAADPGVR